MCDKQYRNSHSLHQASLHINISKALPVVTESLQSHPLWPLPMYVELCLENHWSLVKVILNPCCDNIDQRS